MGKAAFLAGAGNTNIIPVDDDDLMNDDDMFDLSSGSDDDLKALPRPESFWVAKKSSAPVVDTAALEAEKQQAIEQALQEQKAQQEAELAQKLAEAQEMGEKDKDAAVAAALETFKAHEEDLKKKAQAEESEKDKAVAETRKQALAEADEKMAGVKEEAHKEQQAALDKMKAEAEAELQRALETAKAQAATELAQQMAQLQAEAEIAKAAALEEAKNEVSKQAEEHLAEQLEAAKKELTADAEAKVKVAQAQAEEFKELYTEEAAQRRGLHNKLMDVMGNIRVICRIRPVLPTDKSSGEHDTDIVTSFPSKQNLVVRKEDGKESKFEFDNVFPLDSTQQDVFAAVQPMVVSAMDGYKVCIFAYGQTGSGKTFTMEGPPDNPGVTLRALQEILTLAETRNDKWEYTLTMSMLEIYNESVRDLLGKPAKKGEEGQGREGKGLEIRMSKDNASYVEGLNEIKVENFQQIMELMAGGNSHRAVGVHDMNAHSSRSHSIICIKMPCKNRHNNKTFNGKLHLIDLAGSERVGKTGCSGERLKEAQAINKSLSALGDVIAALGVKAKKGAKAHVPFRNSKLTFLLQDSLGGQAKVLMFANASPCMYNSPETVCSLQFAARCRNTALGSTKKK